MSEPKATMSKEHAAQEAMQDMPITLNLTLRKVNYIISMMAQLPYEKAYQPINDLQQMVIGQVQAIQAEAQAKAEAQAQAEADTAVATAANDTVTK